ncbi:MAG: PSD1 and planctomycete cytochrome C domain-containing protein, partial [Planctomycetota bacterium]
MNRLPSFVCCLVVLVAGSVADAGDPKLDFFESKVRPLLIDHCYECHSVETETDEGGLRLDSAAASRRGGHRGPAVVPGKPAASWLIRAVEYDHPDAHVHMPPEGKLSAQQIQILRRWIADGATDPRKEASGDRPSATPSPLDSDPSQHWAFQIPQRRTIQIDFSDESAAQNDDRIDAIAHSVRSGIRSGMEVAGTADRRTLLIRLMFDLSGLRPTANQILAFETDQRPDALERIVDNLLASPEFGRRFARHWLDVARYADTVGYTVANRPRRLTGSESYRNWVIDAFNNDMPLDDLIRYQLAADAFDPENREGHAAAMGFITVGRRFSQMDITVDDQIDVITRGLLGLTVSCARCHDHKFDPIPTSDFYALYGILRSSERSKNPNTPLALQDVAKPRDYHVLIRGGRGNRGQIAPRQYLSAFRGDDDAPFRDGSGRRQLAERIASRDNPLVARVFANRVWNALIGVPIVDTPSDFGYQTSRPQMAPVLDDMAADLSTDFGIKRLVRRIVLSKTYQRSATVTDAMQRDDPGNQLMTRGNRRRRDFESLRDCVLQCSGGIDRRVVNDPIDITVVPTPPVR